METRWRIELLGGLRAARGDHLISHFHRKVGALLAYLAYYRQHPHPREILLELLWPESDPEVGRNNLRYVLHTLRRQLEPSPPPTGSLLITDRQTVQLNPAAFTTDVAAFE